MTRYYTQPYTGDHKENYKENIIPHPYESGRKLLPTSSQEMGLETDDDGNIYYPDINKKAEIRDVVTGKHALDTGENTYDREEELLNAISRSPEDEIPERVKYAERYNQIKELLEEEENERQRKYNKYKDFDDKADKEETSDEDEPQDSDEIEDSLVQADEAEDQNLYYERKIAKRKSDDKSDLYVKQNKFDPNKHPDKDRRHGKERAGDFRQGNRAERQYTKRDLKETLLSK